MKRSIRFALKTHERSSEWYGLVRAGVIDKLCECVIGTRKTFKRRVVQSTPGEPILVCSVSHHHVLKSEKNRLYTETSRTTN